MVLIYLSEFNKKYYSGESNTNALNGGRLDGELILVVPI